MYTEKEIILFTRLGMFDVLSSHIDPITMYNMAVKKVFIENRQDNIAESLRNCIIAITKCYPYRLTKEFDDLINIEDS